MIFRIVVAVLLPTVLSLVITPWVIKFAVAVGATDQPNARKIHTRPMPRIGGVAVYLSFFLSLLLLYILDPALHEFNLIVPHRAVFFVGSLLLVLLLGLWDDIRSLKPKQKFIIQILAATLVYAAGFRISAVSHPSGSGLLDLGLLAYPVTVLWIVGITNAFNLIDGLDGLSSGVATIASLTMSSIAFLNNDYATGFMALILAGSLVGFLRYNFNPARIFLGDCGSLFIGFTVAVLSMQSSTKGSVAVSILVPILALGLPIMDTFLSMLRRLLKSFSPDDTSEARVEVSLRAKLSSIFLPDKAHIHHRLIARGVSHRKVVLLLYTVSCAFGIGAFGITLASNAVASLILVAMGFATVAGIRQLQYKEMSILRNGVLLPLYKSPFFRRSIFQGFLDLGFIILAFTVSYYLTVSSGFNPGSEHEFINTLSIVAAVQIFVFWTTGLYKRTLQHMGIGDALKIIKSVVVAALFTWLFFQTTWRPWGTYSTSIILMDFYLLLTFVAGTRLSYQALNFMFRRESKKGKNVLIYGATTNGILMLQQLLNDDTLNRKPIGFLDDNPQLEGMRVNDYPVFGGHWKLQGLIHKFHIDEILIATDGIKAAVFVRLVQIARTNGIHIKQTKLVLEDVPLAAEDLAEDPKSEPSSSPAGDSALVSPRSLPGLELSNL